jgi:hypothetical protein
LHYRAYFFDTANHIRHAHDLECATDEEARERLEAMDRRGFSAELWRGTRKLASLPAPAPGDVLGLVAREGGVEIEGRDGEG